MELVVLNELVQIDAQELKAYTLKIGLRLRDPYHMVTEGEAVAHTNYVSLLFGVVVAEHLENLDLDLPLLVKLLLVLQYLQRDVLRLLALARGLVVDAPDHHAEGASAQLLDNLVPVIDLVPIFNGKVVAVLAVETVVVDLELHLAAFLLLLWTRLLRQDPIENLSFAV